MPLSAVRPVNPLGGPLPTNPTPRGVGAGGGSGSLASGALGRGIQGALAFKNALGLPSYQDLFKQFGPGSQEFGNANLASSAAAGLKGNLDADRAGLTAQQRNIAAARSGIVNPTGTAGFKNIMRLTNERAGQQAQTDQLAATDAAQRRGYVGGYSPEQADLNRREAVAQAGYQAADEQRQANQDLFTGETGLYGQEASKYGNELGAYTSLTNTAAELPTKYLSAYSGLLSSLGGGYGDIFGTALKGAMFDTETARALADRTNAANTDKLYGRGYYAPQAPGAGGGNRVVG